MSPRLGETTPNTQAKWSICSKEQVKTFLHSQRSRCIIRQQQEESRVDMTGEYVSLETETSSKSTAVENHDHLPGIAFEPDRQCQLLFDRPDARVCNQDDTDGHSFCRQLWLGDKIIFIN